MEQEISLNYRWSVVSDVGVVAIKPSLLRHCNRVNYRLDDYMGIVTFHPYFEE
jgi:hypothetical protein